MRRRHFLILGLAAFFSCKSDQNDDASKEQLKTVLASYYDALAKKDIAKMKSLTSGSFVYYDDGVIYNKESAANFVAQLPPFSATFSFDSMNVYMAGKNASAYYLREAVFTMKDSTYPPARFLESATFNKENDEWKIRFLHSSLRK